MKYYKVGKTKRLEGELNIQGSKNSVLPIIAASILVQDVVSIHNCPDISDVRDMLELLDDLGVSTCFFDNSLYIDATQVNNVALSKDKMCRTRGAILLLGALLARFGEAKVAYPGGCDIGKRPIDIHLEGMTLMNVAIYDDTEYIEAYTDGIRGNEIILRYPSVGATENLMLMAVMATGKTVLKNVAREPEIIDLQDYLNRLGARIIGAGTDCITILGVDNLHGGHYKIIGDRMVAVTYMAATAAVGGKVRLNNINGSHLRSEISCLRRMGCYVKCRRNKIVIARDAKRNLNALALAKTEPFPGLATDAGAMLIIAMLSADGISVIRDTVFEDRFKMVTELQRLGAAATVLKGQIAVVYGGETLRGCEVCATDLRGGAALVLAGMLAEGYTKVYGIEYICRGYEDIVFDLKSLGADITEES